MNETTQDRRSKTTLLVIVFACSLFLPAAFYYGILGVLTLVSAVEIGKAHPLYDVPVKAIARRVDRDDVLFQLLRHLCDYAVVHLTWSGREETNPAWPAFQIYADDGDLMEKSIRPTHKKYEP